MSAAIASGNPYRVILLPATRRDGEAIHSFLSRHDISCQVCETLSETGSAIADEAGALVVTDQIVTNSASHMIVTALGHQPSWSDLPVVFMSTVGTESQEMANLLHHMTNVTLLDRPTSTRTLLSAVQAALRSRRRQYEIRTQIVALKAAEDALRQSDRRKDEFLAMLAHELRNPLAAIRTASVLLPRLLPEADQRATQTFELIERQVRQLTRLVDDLLDVSRITQGRVDIRREPVHLAAVVAQAIETVEPLMLEKRHTIATSVPTEIYINGDFARLVQCVSNIVMNAAKYTDNGGHVVVDAHVVGKQVALSITDDGVGIPSDLLPEIFELFVQNERSLARSEGGLGIGLSVVRRLIEMHGGSVTASSPGAGKGATFRILLPLGVGQTQVLRTVPSVSQQEALRILIVDDNHDAADSLTVLLSMEGHAVETVYGGHDALHSATIFSPHLILLDIGMPEMDGYEVARRLRASNHPARLIALTGYGQKEDIDKALASGFERHIAKPVDFHALCEFIQEDV